MRRVEGPPRSQQGAALLTVLLLVAVIAVLAASALEKVRLVTRLAGNAVALEQSRGYALAAETAAITRINGLIGRDAGRITLAGGWSGRPFNLPIPGGTASATATDGGNCFNLNGLVQRDDQGRRIARPTAITQFVRLMKLVGIAEQPATGIAAAAADWIDSDDTPLPSGAEDEIYQAKATPYRTANTLMIDASELRAVAGMTPAYFAKVRPWVCAQPRAEPSRINVNTLLPEQAPLFAMLLPDTLSVDRARALLLQRPPGGYASTVAFWRLPALAGITAFPEGQAQTAVTTQWFALQIDISLGGTQLTETALIDARRPPARIVSRAWGDPS